MVKEVARELNEMVSEFAAKFDLIPDAEFAAKPQPEKWSKKEVVGHLIDSAQNNLRRFIVGQYEPQPKILYQQNFWVEANQYQQMDKNDIILLWKLINQRIVAVLQNIPEENAKRECMTSELHSIEWLAADYIRHMKHHLNQIIAGSFNILYISK